MDSFIIAIYGLAEYCSYAGLHDKMIQDRIVVGLRDTKLSEKLQLDPELTLEKAVTQVQQAKAIQQQQSLVWGTSKNHKQPNTHIGVVQKRRPNNRDPTTVGKPLEMTCGWCEKAPPHEKQQCSARDAV